MVITRVIIALYGLLFAAVGVGFWVAPDRLAQRFDIQALGIAGLSTLRADLGGAFFTLAALCLGGLWLKRRTPLVAAAAILCVIIVGRLIAWATSGSLAALGPNFVVELGAVVALGLHVRGLGEAADPGVQAPRLFRNLAIGAGVVALLGGTLALAANTPPVQDALFSKFFRDMVGRDTAGLLDDDALRVAICGSSAPLPSANRAKACVAVMAGGKIYIVDTGPESTKTLMEWGVPLDRVDGVLLTHFHSDHIGDLGELNLQTWVAGRAAPLAVYGGPGVDQVVAGFNTAYAQDRGYRTAHHTAALLAPELGAMIGHTVEMPDGVQPHTAVILNDGRMKITAIETNHAPVHPAYAYRFDYKGRSVVVTGDTTEFGPLVAASRGADLMVSEAMNREMIATMEKVSRESGRPRVAQIMRDIQSYHVSPTEAADMANKAGVKLLVFYHLLPAPDNFVLKRIFTRGVERARKGDWDLADDGSLYTLPVGAQDVRIGRVPD